MAPPPRNIKRRFSCSVLSDESVNSTALSNCSELYINDEPLDSAGLPFMMRTLRNPSFAVYHLSLCYLTLC